MVNFKTLTSKIIVDSGGRAWEVSEKVAIENGQEKNKFCCLSKGEYWYESEENKGIRYRSNVTLPMNLGKRMELLRALLEVMEIKKGAL